MGSGVFYSIKMWPMDGQCRKKTIQSSALFPGFASTQPFKPQKKRPNVTVKKWQRQIWTPYLAHRLGLDNNILSQKVMMWLLIKEIKLFFFCCPSVRKYCTGSATSVVAWVMRVFAWQSVGQLLSRFVSRLIVIWIPVVYIILPRLQHTAT